MRNRMAVGAVVLAAMLGAGITLGVQALIGSDEELPEVTKLGESWLQGVDINELAGQGLYLSQPSHDYQPKISASEAKHLAGSSYADVSARQVVLAHLQTETNSGFDGQVYIVNFDPTDPDLHASCPGATPISAFAFVDADNDKLLFTMSSEGPSTGCGPAPISAPPLPTTTSP